MFESYAQEVLPLIDALSWGPNLKPLTRKAIIKAVQDLCHLMDRTIKSVKGSPEYKDKKLQVERFYNLLRPFLSLCKKWHYYIPNHVFASWYTRVPNDRWWYSNPKNMMDEIETTFNSLAKDLSERQLNASNTFSVQSAKIGSGANFDRQFSQRKNSLTLEDLFTLFHQNILAITIFLGQESSVPLEYYPEELQILIKSFKDIRSNLGQIELMNSFYQHPTIVIEFNLGLQNHSAKFGIEYDRTTQKSILHINYFGENWNNRMTHIEQVADLERHFLNAQQKKAVHYDAVGRSIEFSWEFPIERIQQIGSKITNMLDRYTSLANNYHNYFNFYNVLFCQYNRAVDWFAFCSSLSENELDAVIKRFADFDIRALIYEYVLDYAKANNMINIKRELDPLPAHYFKHMPTHIGFLQQYRGSAFYNFPPITEALVHYLLDKGMPFGAGNVFLNYASSFPSLIKRYNETLKATENVAQATAVKGPSN